MKLNKVKSYIFTFLLLGAIPATVYNSAIFAQGTCSIEILNVDEIKGKVVSQGDIEDPVRDAKVELFKISSDDDEEPLIKSVITDEKGFFEMNDIQKGKYRLVAWFTVKGQTYLKYHVILNVNRTEKNKKSDQIVYIRLGMDCFSSDARLIDGIRETLDVAPLKQLNTSPLERKSRIVSARTEESDNAETNFRENFEGASFSKNGQSAAGKNSNVFMAFSSESEIRTPLIFPVRTIRQSRNASDSRISNSSSQIWIIGISKEPFLEEYVESRNRSPR